MDDNNFIFIFEFRFKNITAYQADQVRKHAYGPN